MQARVTNHVVTGCENWTPSQFPNIPNPTNKGNKHNGEQAQWKGVCSGPMVYQVLVPCDMVIMWSHSNLFALAMLLEYDLTPSVGPPL
jgi:hypothetical protein